MLVGRERVRMGIEEGGDGDGAGGPRAGGRDGVGLGLVERRYLEEIAIRVVSFSQEEEGREKKR